MTLEEKRKKVIELCDEQYHQTECSGCPCGNVLTGYCSVGEIWENAPEEEIDKALRLFEKAKSSTTTATEPPDMINHPSHYCREGGMESIEEMILIFGKPSVRAFCLCNAWKYRYRASAKNGEEDLKKSDWYIRKYKELSESDE